MAEKKLRAEKLLKSNVSPEIAAVSIEALGVSPKIVERLKSFVYYDLVYGKSLKYQTIGDLMKAGRNGIMASLGKGNLRYIEADAIVLDIEQKLAKIGLKFEDSDFTVLNVKISELEVSGAAHKLLSSLPKHIRDLSDLSIQNRGKLRARVDSYGNRVLNEIEQAMEKYGMRFVETSYKLDKSKFFPKNWLFEKETVIKKINLIQNKTIAAQNAKMHEQLKPIQQEKDKEDENSVLNDSLKKVGLTVKNIKLLNDNFNIKEITDLCEFSYTSVSKVMGQYPTDKIRKFLQSNGLEFKKKIPKPTKKSDPNSNKSKWSRAKKVIKYRPENVHNFDRNEVLNDSLSSIGVSVITEEILKEKFGITKISDFEGKSCKEIRLALNNNIFQYSLIQNILKALDMPLSKIKEKTNSYKIKNAYFNMHDFTSEEKAAMLTKPIEILGASKLATKLLKENLGVSTIGDLSDKTGEEILIATNNYYAQYKLITEKMKKLGVEIKRNELSKLPFELKDIKTYSKEEQESILSYSLANVGLRPKAVKYLQDINVSTIGDLEKVPRTKVLMALHQSKPQLKILGNILSGLKISYKQTRKNTKTDSCANNQTDENLVQENGCALIDFATILERQGLTVLNDLPDEYFVVGEAKSEDLRFEVENYFKKKFDQQVMGAKTELALDMAVEGLKRERELFESIMQRRTNLEKTGEVVDADKVDKSKKPDICDKKQEVENNF